MNVLTSWKVNKPCAFSCCIQAKSSSNGTTKTLTTHHQAAIYVQTNSTFIEARII